MYAKKTLSNLLQSVADKHDGGDLPSDSATIAFWTRLLNEGQDYCASKLKLNKETPLTTVSGEIALPDDFKTIQRVFKDEEELIQIPYDKSIGVMGLYYWITGNHLDGFKLNTPEDATYTVIYQFRVAEMVNNTDVCVIPDPQAVVLYAYAKIRMSESDPLEDATPSMDEADRRIDEIREDIILNDNNFSFSSII